jgi:hypothetical protein
MSRVLNIFTLLGVCEGGSIVEYVVYALPFGYLDFNLSFFRRFT